MKDEAAGAETSADNEEAQTPSLRDELAQAFGAGETSGDEAEATATATAQTKTTAGDGSTVVSVSGEQTVGNEQAAAGTQILEAPKHWSDADKQLFKTLSPEVQKRWISREGEIQKGLDGKFQEVAEVRKQGEQLSEIFKPFKREMDLKGISINDAVRQLVAAHKYLLESPADAIQYLASSYGVDLKVLVEGAANAGALDPNVKQLREGYTQLQSKIDGFLSQQQQSAHEQNLSKIAAFADEKDASGKIMHPYFDDVAQDIVALIKAGEKDLGAAYKKAVRMNDTIFEKVNAESALDKQKAKETDEKARLDKAKRAGSGSSTTTPAGGTSHKSLRDELEAGLANYGS
jgi:hypothetical protein